MVKSQFWVAKFPWIIEGWIDESTAKTCGPGAFQQQPQQSGAAACAKARQNFWTRTTRNHRRLPSSFELFRMSNSLRNSQMSQKMKPSLRKSGLKSAGRSQKGNQTDVFHSTTWTWRQNYPLTHDAEPGCFTSSQLWSGKLAPKSHRLIFHSPNWWEINS